MSEQADNIEQQGVDKIGPGAMLRQARELMQLSQEEIGDQLNLRVSLLQEIESDQYSGKTPKTFIRGYIRNYAKLVNLDDNDIVARFDRVDHGLQGTGDMKSFSQSTRKKAENNRLMLVIYLLIFSMFVLTIVWWWQQTSSTTALSLAPELNTVTVATQSDDAQRTSEPAIKQTIVESNESADAEPVSQEVAAQPDEIETQDRVFERHMQQSQAEPEAPVETVASQQPEAAQPVANDAPESNLQFTFKGDCWVNIFDANGKRLAWGVKKAGYVMNLNGQAPFKITLGKPELVELSYNQESVDLSGYQIGQIAKFNLPTAQMP
ncbi:RodZ domain-containing protein [Thalassotalea sp. Y01]|uniref:RodZ domain-containing protein n=1 Tax=Thalassotalea sp. Y01 TaxID=2729613 RepID=UPI00145E4B38|nr:RodZ domain-containing protein [Thalassotalea sp. Y01]NMP15957.1 DUF4115 domain-containing protein [Thalassotalea sp. Y01]